MKWRVEASPAYSLLRVWLEPGEEVTAEPEALMLMRGDVEVRTSSGGLLRGLLRVFVGESVFLNTYHARSSAELWFVPPVPGDIAAIEVDEPWVVQGFSYLAHYGDVEVGVAWRGLRGFLAEGELVWLKLNGVGLAWVNAYGAIKRVEVPEGEKLVVDNFHFVAMPARTRYRIRTIGGLKTTLLGGEGLVVEVEGPATVYLQTRILPAFARLLYRFLPQRG